MTDYLVYRHGSNAANQGMCDKLAVAIVTADSQEQALEAAARTHTCYVNQHFSAVATSRAKSADWNSVVEHGSRVPGEPDVVSIEG